MHKAYHRRVRHLLLRVERRMTYLGKQTSDLAAKASQMDEIERRQNKADDVMK